MRVLLDTVTFIRAILSSGKISARTKRILEEEGTVREISAISPIITPDEAFDLYKGVSVTW